MSIASISGSTAGGTPAAVTDNAASLGKDDFLNLLVTQLKSQDPLNPMEGTEFTAQLAQFSSLEQLYNVNANLGELSTGQATQSNAQAVGFIGRHVTAAGDRVAVAAGQAGDIHFFLDRSAASVQVQVSDATGRPVRTLEPGALEGGDRSLTWDGCDGQGRPLADGLYTVRVQAADLDGRAVPTTPYVRALVQGVDFSSGRARLETAQGLVDLGAVWQVQE